MTNDYKNQIEKIKTPEYLKEQTKRLMEQALEDEKIIEIPTKQPIKKKSNYTRIIKIVAAICLLTIPGIYFMQNHYRIEEVNVKELVISPKFGGKEQGRSYENITIKKDTSINIVPDFLREAKKSKIKGVTIQLAKDQQNNYYATYQKGKTVYYIEGKDTNEEDFIDFIKKQI
ncbi:MAG: hypothetical protein RR470_00865 [Vagococcus sp.]|uniref:hypothetical protein n=1 Tax=Vagococcus sp. TaxID=1933889 RepID=UPI002FC86E61